MPEKAQAAALQEMTETLHDLIRAAQGGGKPEGVLSASTRVPLGAVLAAFGTLLGAAVLSVALYFSDQAATEKAQRAQLDEMTARWTVQFERYAAAQADVNEATAVSLQKLAAEVATLAQSQRAAQAAQDKLAAASSDRYTRKDRLAECLATQIVNTESGNTWRCAHPDAAALIGQIRVVVGPDPRRRGGG